SGKQETDRDQGHDDQGQESEVRGDRSAADSAVGFVDSPGTGGSALSGPAGSGTIAPGGSGVDSSADSDPERPGMTGGQARQTAGSLSREQDVADPADRNDAAIAGTDPRLDAVTAPVPDPEQTAEFTLAELEA